MRRLWKRLLAQATGVRPVQQAIEMERPSQPIENAIADDGGIDNGFKAELAGAQTDIEREHDGKMQQFSVYSTSARLVNSSTEDWQKALGGHNIWGTGTVTYDPAKCTYTLKIAVDMEDFHNFNKG
ncbi:MAG: hypothetical protein IT444_11175 [Phycisphaeraceae bacterium]|nr:hypothetical protein [Phycisphaeraceae bacterium]